MAWEDEELTDRLQAWNPSADKAGRAFKKKWYTNLIDNAAQGVAYGKHYLVDPARQFLGDQAEATDNPITEAQRARNRERLAESLYKNARLAGSGSMAGFVNAEFNGDPELEALRESAGYVPDAMSPPEFAGYALSAGGAAGLADDAVRGVAGYAHGVHNNLRHGIPAGWMDEAPQVIHGAKERLAAAFGSLTKKPSAYAAGGAGAAAAYSRATAPAATSRLPMTRDDAMKARAAEEGILVRNKPPQPGSFQNDFTMGGPKPPLPIKPTYDEALALDKHLSGANLTKQEQALVERYYARSQ